MIDLLRNNLLLQFPYFGKFLLKIFGLYYHISKKFLKEIFLKSENFAEFIPLNNGATYYATGLLILCQPK